MYQKQVLSRVILLLGFLHFCHSDTKIKVNDSFTDGDVLVSSGQVFALGFFSRGNSSHRYVGIWYNKVPEQTIVWVANRDNPIQGTSGVLFIDKTGNLVLQDKVRNVTIWSTKVKFRAPANSVSARLQDTGNLILFTDPERNDIAWQSFDYPTNTFLPNMKAGIDRRTGLNRFFTSWKSRDDPGTGDYAYRMELSGKPQLFLFKGSDRLWRSGPWNGIGWSGVPEMSRPFIFNNVYVENANEVSIVSLSNDLSVFTRLVVNESGTLERLTWQDSEQSWVRFWSAPTERCDNYAHCGAFSTCDPYNMTKFECSCLPGFQPVREREWYLMSGFHGCTRKKQENVCSDGEGFIKVSRAKVPDTSTAQFSKNIGLKACGEMCLKNCSCKAYASANISAGGSDCITWYADLIDMRQFSAGGQDVYIRVSATELAQYRSQSVGFHGKRKAITIILSTGAVLLVLSLLFFLLIKTREGKEGKGKFIPSTVMTKLSSRNEMDEAGKNTEVSIFDLNTIIIATDGFDPSNKLGEGGFGEIYKTMMILDWWLSIGNLNLNQGQLPNGLEVAIKRLSKHSGQGAAEFKNEVNLIARLQHRNLVRLLGYCMEQDEKMLVYEYLPNKGLDNFLFDKVKKQLLNWEKLFEIILGIARGMIYLHEDSRLRIIHRDLKASNILLDAAMNPKISDFGMARIFNVNQQEASTRRVVGTYGYMAPEYAMEGNFSTKSDVYSFGVLLLEIISGRKISSHFHEETVNLIGYVWDLWKEKRTLDVVDSSIGDKPEGVEILRCIHVGLLCVQENASDRPSMSEVAFMLCNNSMDLPSPRRPAFIFKKGNMAQSSSSASAENRSLNYMSITEIQAR